MTGSSRTLPAMLLAVVAVALVASGIRPYDRLTWFLEVLPVLVAAPLLIATHRSFPLTPLAYWLIAIHGLILILGAHYTYARVPLGFAMQEWWQLSRNPYDKIGHFMQGFAPVIVAREIFIRGAYVQGRKMLAFLSICVVMMISSSYELIEWGAALALGQGAEEFLGTQGYEWDTQSDMFYALIGACSALLFLTRLHDRQLARLTTGR